MTTILVIEDEAPIRELIGELLMLEGFDVKEAENGQEGVEIAQRYIPDLIICDVMMPELDGYGVLNALQQIAATRVIPFIFLTAKGTRQDQRLGMNLGADDYLVKPFDNEDLLEAIAIRLKKRANSLQQYHQEIQSSKDQIEYLLSHDPLTNLPNQLSLREHFENILSQRETLSKSSSQIIPLIVFSVDRLQRINNLLGYEGGNQVLKHFTEQITQFLNPRDRFIRLNSNEFVLILGRIGLHQSLSEIESLVTQFCQTVLQHFVQPFTFEDQDIPLSLSIGISYYPQDGSTLDNILPKAIAAKEKAKNKGGNQLQFHHSDINTNSHAPFAMEVDLRGALERQEFVVYYQPQINLQTEQILGAEALVRWQHPERGLVPPGLFIPLAEETGLIQAIGEWVLQQAGEQIKAWHHQGLGPLRVAVNLSARQFQEPELASQLQTLLTDLEILPEWLELELTESMLVEDVANSIEQLQNIKALGIRVSMDDFGTGYSSLSYLQQFPFDILKIDQCFIRNIDQNPKNAAIAKAIIQMAHQLNLRIIAEGVETVPELAFVKENGCDDFQGYIVSPPIPGHAFTDLLMKNRSGLNQK